MSVFYSHLIEIESVLLELDKMELSPEEKKHLASLIDSSLRNAILDAVLSKLSDSDKRAFLIKLNSGEDKEIWEFLNQKLDKIEDTIKDVAKKLKEELHQDIREAHSLRSKK